MNSSDQAVENASTFAVCGQKDFELNMFTLLFRLSAKRSTVKLPNCCCMYMSKCSVIDSAVIGVLELR